MNNILSVFSITMQKALQKLPMGLGSKNTAFRTSKESFVKSNLLTTQFVL